MNLKVSPSRSRRSYPTFPFFSRLFPLVVGGLIFLAGCTTDPALKGSRLVVTARNAQFYKDGPAQDFDYPQPTFAVQQTELASGPDFKLPRGTSLTLLKRELGYSHVMTEGGLAGYVANDQVASAPGVGRSVAALDVPRSNPSTISSTRAVQRRTGNHPSAPAREREQQLDLNDLPLP